MPVWHEATAKWRESGELVVIGLVQEQHPDRAQLFAQWRGIDWPILWDPFNLSRSSAVPNFTAIDEHGVVRSLRPRLDSFEEDFLAVEFEAPADAPPAEQIPWAWAVGEVELPEGGLETDTWKVLAPVVWAEQTDLDAAIARLAAHCETRSARAADHFRLGVALRLRYDSPGRRTGDFQGAIDAWAMALGIDPNQYIWRRRIQQYGPRLDKPYPFYDWIETARAELVERGEVPVEVRVPLTGAERLARASQFEAGEGAVEPDPEGAIRRDEGGLVAIESAVAFDTSGRRKVARVHLELTPDAARDVHWTNEAGPLVLWLGAAELPAGWRAEARLLTAPRPPGATSAEARRFDVELFLPGDAEGRLSLPAHALYYVCEGAGGQCLYLRRDFQIELVVPPAGD